MSGALPSSPIVGIATVDGPETEEGAIFRLLDSVDPVQMQILIVCRDVAAEQVKRLTGHRATLAVESIGPAGLSAARNAGLRKLSQLGVGDDVILSFPDDDCHYPEGLLARAAALMQGSDLTLGTYGEGESVSPPPSRRLTLQHVFREGNSVGVFVRFEVLKRVNGFDERLGVGSGDVLAAEDIEFLARCLELGVSNPRFEPSLVVQHPRRSEGVPERSGAYLAVTVRYWRHRESWVRLVRATVGSLLGLSPIPRRRLLHLIRPRGRHGWVA